MELGEPFRDNSNLPKALQRRLEDSWRRARGGVRKQKQPPQLTVLEKPDDRTPHP